MIDNKNIKKDYSIKLFVVILDKDISWIDHLGTVKHKIAKNIGLV